MAVYRAQEPSGPTRRSTIRSPVRLRASAAAHRRTMTAFGDIVVDRRAHVSVSIGT